METSRPTRWTYVGATTAELKKIEPTCRARNPAAEPAVSATGYTITMQGSKSDHRQFSVVNTAGAMTYPCKEPGKGGCPTGGWGK